MAHLEGSGINTTQMASSSSIFHGQTKTTIFRGFHPNLGDSGLLMKHMGSKAQLDMNTPHVEYSKEVTQKL